MTSKTAIIVPTLGTRPKFLVEALKSIRSAGECHILIVSPRTTELKSQIERSLWDQWLEDPMQGLPAAINAGVNSLPSSVEFFNWLGDDDTLAANSLSKSSAILEHNSTYVGLFGKCQYMNENGEPIWMNKSGKFAVPLIRFGPQLIPQPGALFRLSAFNHVGGLSLHYKLAFDLDLLIKLSRIGKLLYVPLHLASFRWHSSSLSVLGRKSSVREAKEIRRLALPKFLQPFSDIWEVPLSRLIYFAGIVITRLDRLKSQMEKEHR